MRGSEGPEGGRAGGKPSLSSPEPKSGTLCTVGGANTKLVDTEDLGGAVCLLSTDILPSVQRMRVDYCFGFDAPA